MAVLLNQTQVYDMTNKIQYRINYDKAIEAIVWLIDQKPGLDI